MKIFWYHIWNIISATQNSGDLFTGVKVFVIRFCQPLIWKEFSHYVWLITQIQRPYKNNISDLLNKNVKREFYKSRRAAVFRVKLSEEKLTSLNSDVPWNHDLSICQWAPERVKSNLRNAYIILKENSPTRQTDRLIWINLYLSNTVMMMHLQLLLAVIDLHVLMLSIMPYVSHILIQIKAEWGTE